MRTQDLTIRLAAERLQARFAAHDQPLSPLFDLAALIACADGVIDAEELAGLTDAANALLGDTLHLGVVRMMLHSSIATLQTESPVGSIHRVVAALQACDAVEDGLVLAVAIAGSSDGISPPERTLIELIGAAAGLASARVEALLADVTAVEG